MHLLVKYLLVKKKSLAMNMLSKKGRWIQIKKHPKRKILVGALKPFQKYSSTGVDVFPKRTPEKKINNESTNQKALSFFRQAAQERSGKRVLGLHKALFFEEAAGQNLGFLVGF